MALTGTVLSSPAVQRKGTISMHPSRTPLSLALAALALTVTACGSSEGSPSSDAGSGASSPAPAHDTTALALGARWLGSQVTEGTVRNEQYGIDDTGLAVDVALALHGVGEQEATVQAVSDRLAEDVATYTAPGFGTLTSAGATAKAVVLAEAVGADPSSYGGTDLVDQLERTVADGGPAAGRIQDVLDPKERSAADYANVVGQAYAVQGLAAADSPEAGAATDFLLAQQCSGGWFRLDFSKDATSADQSCDADPSSKPDLDTTSFALRALRADDSAPVVEARDSALAWLKQQQAKDGSFGGSGAGTPNTNSTGLAGTALGEAEDTAGAERAATWVFGRQAVDCQSFPPAVRGAIAYDDAGLATAARRGISVKAADQFRRASAGALPVLRWLPTKATADRSAGSC